MSEVKWIKLSTDMFDNEKIKYIEALEDGDSLIVMWLKLLILAGKTNDNGDIYVTKKLPFSDEMLAKTFGFSLEKTRNFMLVLVMLNMVDVKRGCYHISNWNKYQNLEKLEKIKEQNRVRKQNQRAKSHADVTQKCHADVTQCHATDIDIDIE